jgi:hypothetical protein
MFESLTKVTAHGIWPSPASDQQQPPAADAPRRRLLRTGCIGVEASTLLFIFGVRHRTDGGTAARHCSYLVISGRPIRSQRQDDHTSPGAARNAEFHLNGVDSNGINIQ